LEVGASNCRRGLRMTVLAEALSCLTNADCMRFISVIIMITAFSRAEQIEGKYRNRLGERDRKAFFSLVAKRTWGWKKQETDSNMGQCLVCFVGFRSEWEHNSQKHLFHCNCKRKKFERRERALAIIWKPSCRRRPVSIERGWKVLYFRLYIPFRTTALNFGVWTIRRHHCVGWNPPPFSLSFS